MSSKLSVQLYSVREECAKDFVGTIKKIAGMGYKSVEPAGFSGTTPEEAAKLFADLGLEVVSMHGPLPIGEDKNKSIETAKLLGAKYIVSGKGPDDFKTSDKIKAVADLFNEAAENAAQYGISVAYHNHYWEIYDVEGKCAYDILVENLSDKVISQIDSYWVKVGGTEPAELIAKLGDRVKLVHIKDGPCTISDPMQALGTGKLDIPSVVQSSKYCESFIVELDRCEGDMLTAIDESYKYLSSLV